MSNTIVYICLYLVLLSPYKTHAQDSLSQTSEQKSKEELLKQFKKELRKRTIERYPNGKKKHLGKLSLFNTYRSIHWDTLGNITFKSKKYKFWWSHSPRRTISYDYHENGKLKKKERIDRRIGSLPKHKVKTFDTRGKLIEKKRFEMRYVFD